LSCYKREDLTSRMQGVTPLRRGAEVSQLSLSITCWVSKGLVDKGELSWPQRQRKLKLTPNINCQIT